MPAFRLTQLQLPQSRIPVSTTAKLAYLFIACVSTVIYCTVCLNWNMNAHELLLHQRLSNFYGSYPTSSTSGADPFNVETTEQRLSKAYPYNDTPRLLQRNIWQMWKTKKDVPYDNLRDRWRDMNPNFKYKMETNENLIDLVKEEFKDTVPEIAETLELLPSLILKSDFSRYVVLFLYGGSYSDLDVWLHTPMDDWFDSNRNVGFVCGSELDYNGEQWGIISRRNQVQSWFFKSKARHPVLRKLIATIVKTTFETLEKGLEANYGDKHGEARCNTVDIMDWTGPAVFTDVIYAHLNSMHNPTIMDTDINRWNFPQKIWGPDLPDGVGISWKITTGINWPIMFNDVVLYPQHTVRGEHADQETRDVYISHLFSGSWKPH